jgi:hypothetical protein
VYRGELAKPRTIGSCRGFPLRREYRIASNQRYLPGIGPGSGAGPMQSLKICSALSMQAMSLPQPLAARSRSC